MGIYYQIILALFIVVVIQVILFAVIFNKIRKKTPKDGIRINEKIPNINCLDIDQQRSELFSNISKGGDTLLFSIVNCTACTKVLDILNTMQPKYLENIILIIANSDDSAKELVSSKYSGRALLAKKSDVIEYFNIKAFPFVLRIDGNMLVKDKDYASIESLLKHIL